MSNLQEIEKHNQLYEDGQTSYKQGINQFSDMVNQQCRNI